jgi:uncharacterized protein with von Willebrand factor type A (vWA) domain
MLIDFFFSLRHAKLPVSVKEYLTMLEALRAQVIAPSIDEFYYLSRMTLVKDEKHFDKFDQTFAAYFKGVESLVDWKSDIPLDWLQKTLERELSAEEKAKIEAMGGLDKLMERLKQLLEEQKESTRAATSGSARAAPRRSATAATTPRASASAARPRATAPRSRCGRRARTRITTTRSNSARATSRWRCAACAVSRARAPTPNSISTTPSTPPPPTRGCSTSSCGPSATTRSRC